MALDAKTSSSNHRIRGLLERDVTIWELKQAIRGYFYDLSRPSADGEGPTVEEMTSFMKHQCSLTKQVHKCLSHTSLLAGLSGMYVQFSNLSSMST